MIIKLPVRQVILLVLVLVVGVPLLTAAQDSGPAQPGVNDDDLIVPLGDSLTPTAPVQPTTDPAELFVTLESLVIETATVPAPTARPTRDPVADQAIPMDWQYTMEGIWIREFGGMTRSGDCSGLGSGDNGGGVRDLGDDDPGKHAKLCLSLSAGVVFLDGETYRWDRTPGVKDVYLSGVRIDSYDNSRIEKVMKVIDDYNIDVVTTITDGSCTVTYVTHYRLYIPGDLFGCSANDPLIQDVNDQGTPVAVTPEPEIIEPVKAGEYTITWLPFYGCDPAYIPTFTSAAVQPASFDRVRLIINGETFSLNGDGQRGEFNEYGSNRYITLERRFVDDFNFIWQVSSPDKRESCYAQGVLKLTTPDAAQPNFSQPTPFVIPTMDFSGTPMPTMAVIDPIAGAYSVTWGPMPGLDCPPELMVQMPTAQQASLVAAGDTFLLDFGTASYPLEMLPGASQWMYMNFADDSSGVTVSLSQTQPGEAVGSFSYFTPDGQFCMLMMELHQ